jgi:hypothetical protein
MALVASFVPFTWSEPVSSFGPDTNRKVKRKAELYALKDICCCRPYNSP